MIAIKNYYVENVTLTQKHSDSGKVAMITRNEKRVKMKAQMPGPPGSAENISSKKHPQRKTQTQENKKIN